MTRTGNHKLDNPVWHSLNETHAAFSLTFGDLKCYHTDICPFGGYTGNGPVARYIDEYATHIDHFFIVGQQPDVSKNLVLQKELICLQMVIENKIDHDIREEMVPLNNRYDKELFNLVNLVQPGYFKNNTVQLGNYYGIFKNSMLVAAAGERMKMDDYTEVSAIVTHPQYTGKGYAKQLIAHTINRIFDKHKMPYLHVAETNATAIALYQKLSFVVRRKISFWNFAHAY